MVYYKYFKMRKTNFQISLLAFSIVFFSCKQNDMTEQQLDANNNVVANGQNMIDPLEEQNKMKKIANMPILSLEEKEFDFGVIKEGDIVEHVYKFTNTGKTDLFVIEAKPSCGCTVPEWTKTPVKPGESGQIKIAFNSKGKKGTQQKYINLLTNTEAGNESFSFKATVK